MSSLVECFSIIRDPHQESKLDHELIDILILCVLAVRKDWAIENQLHLGPLKKG